jgi:hypothetical protein
MYYWMAVAYIQMIVMIFLDIKVGKVGKVSLFFPLSNISCLQAWSYFKQQNEKGVRIAQKLRGMAYL